MPSSQNDGSCSWRRLSVAAALLATLLVGGCIADTAADSDLPWATNQGWEGMIPIPAGAMNQYD